MRHDDVLSMIEEMGLPSAYDHFVEGQSPDPPFLVFLVCAPWARSSGCKSRIRPGSGKYIAEQQGCSS